MASGRTRSRGTMEPLVFKQYITDNSCNSSTIINDTMIGFGNGSIDLMTDQIVPRFRNRSAEGEIFVNPMNSKSEKRTSGGSSGKYKIPQILPLCDISYEITDGAAILVPTSCGSLYHLAGNADVDALKTLAGTQAAAKIDDPIFHGAVFLGELRETIGFLRAPLRNLNKYLNSLRKRGATRGYKGRTLASYISDNWLQYRYGIKPLVMDVQDALEAVDSLKEKPLTNRKTARGYHMVHENHEGSISGWFSTMWQCHKDIKTRIVTECRAGVLYEIDARDTFGLGLNDIPDTAWEVIPYSFVADWFWNVGDYITAITPKAGVRHLGSWTTVTITSVSSGDGYADAMPPGLRQEVLSPSSVETLHTVTKEREVGIDVGLASKPLPFDGDFGKPRILDSLALIYSNLNRVIK